MCVRAPQAMAKLTPQGDLAPTSSSSPRQPPLRTEDSEQRTAPCERDPCPCAATHMDKWGKKEERKHSWTHLAPIQLVQAAALVHQCHKVKVYFLLGTRGGGGALLGRLLQKTRGGEGEHDMCCGVGPVVQVCGQQWSGALLGRLLQMTTGGAAQSYALLGHFLGVTSTQSNSAHKLPAQYPPLLSSSLRATHQHPPLSNSLHSSVATTHQTPIDSHQQGGNTELCLSLESPLRCRPPIAASSCQPTHLVDAVNVRGALGRVLQVGAPLLGAHPASGFKELLQEAARGCTEAGRGRGSKAVYHV